MLSIMRHACLCGLALLVPCLAAPGGLAGGFFEELLEEKWDWRAFDFSKEEAQFIQAHKDEYGYNGKLARIRDADTPHVVDQIYLDYTGSGVYRASMVDEMAKGLKRNLYGNPHSHNPSSMLTDKKVENVRSEVVKFFNTTLSEYTVIFTSGATAALHLIGESFPWSNTSKFYYLRQNHNSVLGIRELTLHNGGTFKALNDVEVEPHGEVCNHDTAQESRHDGYNLFAFPAEDNFAGVKYPLSWIEDVHKRNAGFCAGTGDWRVLLDAAAFVPTQALDLGTYKPDFVTLSFYKMFGFPTGLGALLVHRRSVDLLRKVYWGGGSVVVAMATEPVTVFKMNPCSRFEDGTLNFISIMALEPGLASSRELGMDNISRHVWSLTRYLYEHMMELRHGNGAPVVEVYGKHDQADPKVQGGVISFNLKHPDGKYVSFDGVQREAARHDIHIRSGCQCNPGACFGYLGLTNQQVSTYFVDKNSCGDGPSVVEDGTQPLGALRVSIGYLTTFKDVRVMLEFLRYFYVKASVNDPLPQ